MTGLRKRWFALGVECLLSGVLATTGCHSSHVEITVENRTGAGIHLLEVDYPSASFGADRLAPGAEFQCRIQIRGTGPLKVAYTAAGGLQETISGPTLTEDQQGRLGIVLLPGGKVEFHPELKSGR
jgi:hypothetical protein